LRPVLSRAVERALDVDELRIRVFAVSRAAFEAVEQSFRTGCCDLEDGSVVVCATLVGHAVERALEVKEAPHWGFAVPRAAFEAVEQSFRTGHRDLEDGSVAVCAPF